MVRLDIFSDPVCPWCYIGKANLFKALEGVLNPFELTWRPFQLNPDMPREGADRRAYLEAKFGKEAAARSYAVIDEHAAKAGVSLNHDKITRIPNTLDAHRLIHWATLEGRATPVVSGLFTAYWQDGRDIGDAEVLADIGAEWGMDREMILRLIASGADEAEIRDLDVQARGMGVTAVPTFIVAERHVVPGAQPPDLWRQVIAEIEGTEAS
ncbi:DsbA family oxidoreductase [Pseudoroseicyclus tamaricis]|uniref:DsbA family oxidoreductase n=1 Tax=Pseudoroseicyclus tamaricis TaxID=2705421 RepID=A0A6B2JHV7_9RHOB|nr:DsbA family oxidoreductase [Pseudoroseicyclus tamaricis]NDV00883.1 DsbA family oxidoreductase [Pseudoroseicyclus tamaricis]